MGLAASKESNAPDRLTRFRELRARLNPSGDPSLAFSQGLYVRQPGSVSQRLVAELSLSPSSTHLLIGGVGSGKTTELLSAQQRLNELADTRALYIDVSKQHDVGKMVPGVLVVQAGLALANEIRPHLALFEEGSALVQQDHQRLYELAEGYEQAPNETLSRGEDTAVRVRGILSPPGQLEGDVVRAVAPLRRILASLKQRWKHTVVLFDGLDRVTDIASFEQLIERDVRALSSYDVGVVLVGPLKAQYGIERALMEHFDQFHYQPWLDLAEAPEAGSFLEGVLRQRVPVGVFDDAALEDLITYSGGVLRDLLSLAQSACVESYMGGVDVIGEQEVIAAIDAFGRKHMQGLRPTEIAVLKRVFEKGTFVQTSEDELALLMTRRVLEYRSNGRPRYEVHPTITEFLTDAARGRG